MNLRFLSFLFDSEDTWRQAIKDPDYRYDMPLSHFMIIYNRYRTEISLQDSNIGLTTSEVFKPLEYTLPKEEPKKAKEDNSILSQSEIDSLLSGFSN